MILRWLGSFVALFLGALAAVVLLVFSPLDRALVLDVYLVFAGAVALQALAGATRAATRAPGSSALEDALRRQRRPPGRPERLLRLEGLVSLASATAGDYRTGLRPELRRAAAHRLWSRHGIELDAEPDRAARVLGPEAWELLRPDRDLPGERFEPGPPPTDISRAVGAIERISS